MFVVAVTRLATPPDQEAGPLSILLGKTTYETRLLLNAGLPAVVLTTADLDAATALLGALRARGHGVVACDAEAVRVRRDMRSLHHFRFEDGELVSADALGAESRLRYADVLALLRAVHKRSSATRREVHEKKFAAGRALLTGGMAMSKKVSREVVEVAEDREEVLYLFRHDGEQPWILVDGEARYAGLGPRLMRTQRENFVATVECLRAMCPAASYDERLLANNRVPERFTRSTGIKASETSSSDGMDLLAHLLALAIARGQAS